ncbi:hypothetical protein B0H66DRAFT_453546, partial [Apodospora peruviana]
SYDQLNKDGFPAKAFVNPEFIIYNPLGEGGQPVPVSHLRILHINGGFLLFVNLHHLYGDGSCLSIFIDLFAAETSKTATGSARPADESIRCSKDLPRSQQDKNGQSFDTLLAACPEYRLLPIPTGPTMPPLDGVSGMDQSKMKAIGMTFVIDTSKLSTIIKASKTSKFYVLAALTWAHTTKARLAVEPTAHLANNQKPMFWNPHDWLDPRKKLFSDNLRKTYFGNSVTVPITTSMGGVDITLQDLVDACLCPNKILQIAQSIMAANHAVDEDFVLTRTALFESAPPGRLGLALDPLVPGRFSVNTWGFLGRDARFWFPGQEADCRADAIRRVQGAWAPVPHGLVLPVRPESGDDELEMVVTLSRVAMEELLRDGDWMGFVKRVV